MENKDQEPADTSKTEQPLADATTSTLQAEVASKTADAVAGKEKVDLGIDWDSLNLEALLESMRNFDNAENIFTKIPDRPHDSFLIHQTELKTATGEKILLKVLKVISPNYHELHINLVLPPHGHIASFDYLQLAENHSEEWDMKHRITLPIYRNQGIAGKIIDLTEKILQNRQKNNGLPQSISVKSGQKDLTQWLEKRNFTGATPEDAAKLQRLNAKENGLQTVVVSGHNYANGEIYSFDPVEFKSKFEDQVTGPEDPKVWNDDNHSKPFFYMQSCYRIKLQKQIAQ